MCRKYKLVKIAYLCLPMRSLTHVRPRKQGKNELIPAFVRV
jgi:hypothetical protein